jgi:hypothetical protein
MPIRLAFKLSFANIFVFLLDERKRCSAVTFQMMR